MTIKLEGIALMVKIPELNRKPGEEPVKYLKRITVYMNSTLAGLDGKYEETLR